MSIRLFASSIPGMLFFVLAWSSPNGGGEAPSRLADTYVDAVRELNEANARRPVTGGEAALGQKLPKAAVQALDELLSIKGNSVAEALARCGEAALDIDRMADFERVRECLTGIAPQSAARLGIALDRPRFLARGLDGIEKEGLAKVADAFDAVLSGYDQVFGFQEWSKVPGKKLRLRVHLVPKIEAPPHFAPQFPWHSEIDFPVEDSKAFSSPTKEGKMLLYGLCHELGHVIAMWGDARNEEDHHTWAHFTGLVVLDHVTAQDLPATKGLRDGQWYSLSKERTRLADEKVKAGRGDKNSTLALFVAAHDLVGPRAMGLAINALDTEDKCLRVNRVRYYGLDAFARALLATDAGKKKAKELRALFE